MYIAAASFFFVGIVAAFDTAGGVSFFGAILDEFVFPGPQTTGATGFVTCGISGSECFAIFEGDIA